MKIVVLAGGYSPERDVSLYSGSLIANALLANGHEVALLDLYEGVQLSAPPEAYFHSPESGAAFSYTVPETAPDMDPLPADASLVGPGVLDLCRTADLVFLSLHGLLTTWILFTNRFYRRCPGGYLLPGGQHSARHDAHQSAAPGGCRCRHCLHIAVREDRPSWRPGAQTLDYASWTPRPYA